jgi:hypothetical protein
MRSGRRADLVKPVMRCLCTSGKRGGQGFHKEKVLVDFALSFFGLRSGE